MNFTRILIDSVIKIHQKGSSIPAEEMSQARVTAKKMFEYFVNIYDEYNVHQYLQVAPMGKRTHDNTITLNAMAMHLDNNLPAKRVSWMNVYPRGNLDKSPGKVEARHKQSRECGVLLFEISARLSCDWKRSGWETRTCLQSLFFTEEMKPGVKPWKTIKTNHTKVDKNCEDLVPTKKSSSKMINRENWWGEGQPSSQKKLTRYFSR